jgi:hypothetical protein
MSAITATARPVEPVDGAREERGMPRWPLLLLAAPAGVATWSGWVGLGGMTGFGKIHPLPGLWDSLELNTAITLPIGVEAYAAYALGAWVSSRPMSQVTRRFAAVSTVGSLLLGMAGQVAYHLLQVNGRQVAPWWIVTIVSCLPVLVLGMGAALSHLLARDHHAAARTAGAERARTARPRTAEDAHARTADERTDRTGTGASRTDAGADSSRAGQEEGQPRTGRTPGIEAPPVDRDVIVAELAEQIMTASDSGGKWQPDYPALQARTGYKRSWCEKAVRDARRAVFRTEPSGNAQAARTDGKAA